MFRKQMTAKLYKVLKPLTFRGIEYKPGDSFDPVKAQCVPVKLNNLIRQRILGEDGPDLAESIKQAAPVTMVHKQPADAVSDADAGDVPPVDPPEDKPARKSRRQS